MQSCYHLRVPSSELSGDHQPRGRTCCQVMVSGRGAVTRVECEKQKTKRRVKTACGYVKIASQGAGEIAQGLSICCCSKEFKFKSQLSLVAPMHL